MKIFTFPECKIPVILAVFEEVGLAVAVLKGGVDIVGDAVPVGDGPGVAGINRGIFLRVKLVVICSLEKVDFIILAPDKCCVDTIRDAFKPVGDLLRKAL